MAANSVFPGRFTAQADQPFVVFLIGMRVNKPLAVRKWMSVASAMGPMMETLYVHPEKGFLGGESFFRFFPLTTILVSYWRSFEDLERFAWAKDDPHLEPTRRYFQQIGKDGSVGIWHETYQVNPGGYETIYGNMPLFGLAKATQHVQVRGGRDKARERLEQGA